MSDAQVTPGESAATGTSRRPFRPSRRVLVAAAVAVVVFAAVGAFVWSRRSGGSGTSHSKPAAVHVAGVRAEVVSATRLRALAATSGGSVYWAGPRAGTHLEYTQKTDGTTYVRYLTGTATAGAPGAGYVVVATYRQPDAFARVKQSAQRQHLFVADLPNGALAVTRPARPQNIYVVYPHVPYQIEVYTPKQAETRRIVFAGRIQPVH